MPSINIRISIALSFLALTAFSPLVLAESEANKAAGFELTKKSTASKSVTGILPLILDGDGDSPVTPPPGDPLFQINQLKYQGAFRLDGAKYGGDDTRYSVNYAVGTLAYNPKNHSLFIVGHAQASRVAEFPIPEPSKQTLLLELPESEPPIQNFTTVFPDNNDQGINRITGMLWYKDALIVNAEQWYNASGANTDTSFVIADADNIGGSVSEFFRLDGRANSAGYMSAIPADLQTLFGGADYFTGWSSVYSIVSRYSYSPSLWTFDPDDLLNRDATTNPNITATAHMNFSYSTELRAELDSLSTQSGASPLWNILSNGYYGFFVPGTKTFAVLGTSGGIESGIGYKIRQSNGNLCGGYCTVDPDDNYNYYWLYNLDDILNAENVSDPRPYAYGKLSLPFDDEGAHGIIGATLDTASNTLYIALRNAGQVGAYDRPPLILTYSLP